MDTSIDTACDTPGTCSDIDFDGSGQRAGLENVLKRARARIVEDRSFDGERALYGSDCLTVRDCRFDGPADGESAFKESSCVVAQRCFFNLRYPFWHNHGLVISDSEMTELCRASLWYSDHVVIKNTAMHGIKAVRECSDVVIRGCDIVSPEFGWFTRGISMRDCTAQSEYFLMRSRDVDFANVEFAGKYSFQYIDNGRFDNCRFDTKDAFWHAKNVIVRNSVVKGEYLAWYSENLVFENCTIIGTQPLCYCKGLKLIDCKMVDTDLCFEKSDVEAVITTPVDSVKNVRSGIVALPSVGEAITDDPCAKGRVVLVR